MKETSYLTDTSIVAHSGAIATTIGNYIFDQQSYRQRPRAAHIMTAMKLCQGQVWKKDGQYIRIVRLERLQVEYKTMENLADKSGEKIVTSKKDFCRLLKGAHLLAPKIVADNSSANDKTVV